MPRKTPEEIEFGDFQTPYELARKICELLQKLNIAPTSILEPTCGQGNLLFAALDAFPQVQKSVGLDISPAYIATAQVQRLRRLQEGELSLMEANFFDVNWSEIISLLPDPLLVLGNPPWVTNSQVAVLGGGNVPFKNNFQEHRGLDAKTGKSNFDISEWMLIQCLEWLNGCNSYMAVLCKTSVARKLLKYAHKNHISLSHSRIYHIDAARYFGAMVDACLFICHFERDVHNYDCRVYIDLEANEPERVIGYRGVNLVSRVELYEKWNHLEGNEHYKWRSGIKHDCSRIMELAQEEEGFRNGFGEFVHIEDSYLYPMLKTSEVAKASACPTRYMLVTQQEIGAETESIKEKAPQTWSYLIGNAHLLDGRGSVIYKNRPRFSIFGVGKYSFAPWKVAISGFYKRLEFRTIGPVEGRSVVLDDASYFLACQSEEEANLIASLLNSTPAKQFFESLIFWDSKRPITIDLLRKLDLTKVACELGVEDQLNEFLNQTQKRQQKSESLQLQLI